MSKLRIAAGELAAVPVGATNTVREAKTVVITDRGRSDVAMVGDQRRNALKALGRHAAGRIDFEPPRFADRPRGARF
jgi:hypothetical protein